MREPRLSAELETAASDFVDAIGKVRSVLASGLLEAPYRRALAYELASRGRRVRSEVPIPVRYGGVDLGLGHRLDLLVDDFVAVADKCVEALAPVHYAQLLTYLYAADLPLGFLVNFHAIPLRSGIKRIVPDPKRRGNGPI